MPSSWARSLDRLAVGAVADEAEPRVDAALAQARERGEHVRDALDRRHPADPADDERARPGRRTGAAARSPSLVAARDPPVEVDPEPDHRELARRRDAERDEVVAHLRADRDEPRRLRGERAARASRKAAVRAGSK